MSPESDKLLSLNIVRLALATPWKARNEIERLLLIPFAWLSLNGAGINIGTGWKWYGLPIFQKHRDSSIVIGKNCNLRSTRRSNPLAPNHPCVLSTRRPDANLTIGDDFGMTGGAIVCEEKITIGQRVTMGANSIITDTDFHPIDPVWRYQYPSDGKTAPVIVEDDVFIGMQVLILKGVTIGKNSVIGAGSVVTKTIPAGVIAAGNPARVIREL
jgi:acetyltransferase-like isoleucine patch superfamily enzyme